MTPDELDDYEHDVDRDEAVVSEFENERDLSDAEELADVVAERDCSHFDETRWTYSGVDRDDDVDVRELKFAGALLDDPDDSDDSE